MQTERPRLSMMGIQSGDNYLRDSLNAYSKYCDTLERILKDIYDHGESFKLRAEIRTILGLSND
jgi:hypothetical protein